jgi:hypothetical protein
VHAAANTSLPLPSCRFDPTGSHCTVVKDVLSSQTCSQGDAGSTCDREKLDCSLVGAHLALQHPLIAVQVHTAVITAAQQLVAGIERHARDQLSPGRLILALDM